MLEEPAISCGSRKRLIRIIACLVFAGVILSCLVFPKVMFADESVVSAQTPSEAIPDNPVPPERESSRDALDEEVLIESLKKDVVMVADNTTEDDGQWKVVRMRVTAYCPCEKCCGAFSDGITANNHCIEPGDTFVAADKSYPFETEMVIPGYNDGTPVQVMDRGGAIKGERLDLFFHTHQEALEWGVQYLDVRIKTE